VTRTPAIAPRPLWRLLLLGLLLGIPPLHGSTTCCKTQVLLRHAEDSTQPVVRLGAGCVSGRPPMHGSTTCCEAG
jgi:hypothetical protein